MKQFKGIIFDMDGLLVDTEKLYYRGIKEIADQMQIPYDFQYHLRYVGVSDEEMWTAFHERYNPNFGEEYVTNWIKQSYQHTLELFDTGEADLKPGAQELIDYLLAKRIPMGIATSNQRKVVDLLLEAHNLLDSFDFIFSAEDVKNGKPDPELFLKAQERLQIPPQKLLVLEDSKNGILAAAKAQIPVIMVPDLIAPTPEITSLALEVLTSLHEVLEFIKK